MALKCRGEQALDGLYTGINTQHIVMASKMVYPHLHHLLIFYISCFIYTHIVYGARAPIFNHVVEQFVFRLKNIVGCVSSRTKQLLELMLLHMKVAFIRLVLNNFLNAVVL